MVEQDLTHLDEEAINRTPLSFLIHFLASHSNPNLQVYELKNLHPNKIQVGTALSTKFRKVGLPRSILDVRTATEEENQPDNGLWEGFNATSENGDLTWK